MSEQRGPGRDIFDGRCASPRGSVRAAPAAGALRADSPLGRGAPRAAGRAHDGGVPGRPRPKGVEGGKGEINNNKAQRRS